jgi:hypothetical protein
MALKQNRRGSKKAVREINCDKEWVRSVSDETTLNNLVVHGVLPDRATAGWCLAAGENFPMPYSDELVVFNDYFFRGFGIPIHPFLRGLIDYYGVSLCNLCPNSILHVAIFINPYESYLGILPHFDLFRHFFCLKIRRGAGSRVIGSAYLQLRDGMASHYIIVPLNTNVKY